MTEALTGVDFRVFRSLLQEYDRDTIDDIRIELSRDPVPVDEIEDALNRLVERQYVEEHEPGRWRITPRGLAVKGSLLGDPPT